MVAPEGFDRTRVYVLGDEHLGRLLGPTGGQHHAANCSPGPCPLHYPSPHRLSAWPLMVGEDVRLFVRLCPHLEAHPDPDDPRWSWSDDGHVAHGCDGCCTAEPPVDG